MIQKIFTTIILFTILLSSTAQEASDRSTPVAHEFISYSIRELAEDGDLSKNEYYQPLTMESSPTSLPDLVKIQTEVEVPYAWLNRDVFINVGGVTKCALEIDNKSVDNSTDSRCPSRFNISKHISNGRNLFLLSFSNDTLPSLDGKHVKHLQDRTKDDIYIYSQPKMRIEDYHITTTPDITDNRHTLFSINIAVSNSYNTADTMVVGYDIYSPEGKLCNYDMRPMVVDGNGRDTLRLTHIEYGTTKNHWSEKSPKLYSIMLYVKDKNRITEYIPLKQGISEITFDKENIFRNGTPIDIKATNYNAKPNLTTTKQDIQKLKSKNFNTIIVDYPQPIWFYEQCDAIGMNVIDQANINDTEGSDNREIGGTLSNDPFYLSHYINRTIRTIKRNSNRTSVIAISLGGEVGNGYNLYKSYQKAKTIEQNRPIIVRDNAGEWNSDMDIPTVSK